MEDKANTLHERDRYITQVADNTKAKAQKRIGREREMQKQLDECSDKERATLQGYLDKKKETVEDN